MIAHFSLPAREPRQVAEVFAALLDGVTMPFPVVPGAWVAIARDGSGCGVEVLPEASAFNAGTGEADANDPAQGPMVKPWEVQIRQDGYAQATSGFHVAITTSKTAEEIVELVRPLGWRAVPCDRGGVFNLVELWVENRYLIEVLPPTGVERYLAFYNPEVAGQMFGAAH